MRERKRERGKKMKGGNWCSRVGVTVCVLTTSLACSSLPACSDYHRGHVILNQPCKQGVGFCSWTDVRTDELRGLAKVGPPLRNWKGCDWHSQCHHGKLWFCFVYSVFCFFKIKRVKLRYIFAVHHFSFLVTKSLFPFHIYVSFNCLTELTTLHLIWRR